MITDRHGLALSTASREAAGRLDAAGRLFALFRPDPVAEIGAALAADPGCAMAHAMRAALLALSTEQRYLGEVRRSVEAGEALWPQANERERAHLAACRAWLEGNLAAAGAGWGAVAEAWPRDLFALQCAHHADFFQGRKAALRDRPARALAAWGADEPARGVVLGMQAFGLEECGAYDAAEQAGRAAIAAEPGDSWAIHAVAHVLEMQGRAEEGARFLAASEVDWTPGELLAVHNWWHLALFHLDRGEVAETLAIYDRAVRPGEVTVVLALLDAAAMLWRLMLGGVAPGQARWDRVADGFATVGGYGHYAFNDAHAVMAFLGAGRDEEAKAVLRAMEAATARQDSNAAMTREVGLPLVRGLLAFARGAWREAAALLAPVPAVAARFGGSDAQRDVIALTLLESLIRAGERGAAADLLARRLAAKPGSAIALGARERLAA